MNAVSLCNSTLSACCPSRVHLLELKRVIPIDLFSKPPGKTSRSGRGGVCGGGGGGGGGGGVCVCVWGGGVEMRWGGVGSFLKEGAHN